jgi:hypothetical protein
MKVRYLALVLIGFASAEAAAQSGSPQKDIPTIAKTAKGAIVTIVMAANDKPIALGTGFLVNSDGVIVTNYHVIKTGNVAVVKFPDGTILPVDGVLAIDKFRDLAIIKIHGKPFPTLTLGNSDQIQVGEEVVAIGNPLGLELTVSNGILSGIRSDETEGGKLLQITAPISRGSSGGPLFNMFGEVVGINVMFLEGGESLNFAIPVNDAKLLLSLQSAKLQNLPNENEAAPTDAPPSTAGGEGLTSSTKGTEEAYYVRSRKGETYIIEYRGHQLTAHCRESLSWLDGEDKLGRALAGECVYLSDKVGKHFSEDFIVRGDNELRYRPYGHFETSDGPVADVLDITDDVLLGAPKHSHPAPKTSPDIQKTLHWIQNTLDDREGNTQYLSEDGEIVNHINLIAALNGCQVTFAYETREVEKDKREEETFHSRTQVNLGDLDPTSITSDLGAPEILGLPVSTVRVHTTDTTPSVNLDAGARGWEPARIIATTDLLLELPSPYAERFVKALKHAITLCGGKTSAF